MEEASVKAKDGENGWKFGENKVTCVDYFEFYVILRTR
jgi:hypothetical protein